MDNPAEQQQRFWTFEMRVSYCYWCPLPLLEWVQLAARQQ